MSKTVELQVEKRVRTETRETLFISRKSIEELLANKLGVATSELIPCVVFVEDEYYDNHQHIFSGYKIVNTLTKLEVNEVAVETVEAQSYGPIVLCPHCKRAMEPTEKCGHCGWMKEAEEDCSTCRLRNKPGETFIGGCFYDCPGTRPAECQDYEKGSSPTVRVIMPDGREV